MDEGERGQKEEWREKLTVLMALIASSVKLIPGCRGAH